MSGFRCDGLVKIRIEYFALSFDAGYVPALKRRSKLPVYRLDALEYDLYRSALLARLDGSLEVIQNGKKFAYKVLCCQLAG